MVFADVVKRDLVVIGILANAIADLVGQVFLQPALLNVYYFIKKALGVEAQNGAKSTLFIFFIKRTGGQVFLGAEGILQLIAVKLVVFGA